MFDLTWVDLTCSPSRIKCWLVNYIISPTQLNYWEYESLNRFHAHIFTCTSDRKQLKEAARVDVAGPDILSFYCTFFFFFSVTHNATQFAGFALVADCAKQFPFKNSLMVRLWLKESWLKCGFRLIFPSLTAAVVLLSWGNQRYWESNRTINTPHVDIHICILFAIPL